MKFPSHNLSWMGAVLMGGCVAVSAAESIPVDPTAPPALGARLHGVVEVPSGERWVAQVRHEPGSTALFVVDRDSDTRYRLSDFENLDIVRIHWIGPDQLEVDFPQTERVVEIRHAPNASHPTFHLVTTRFDVDGASRIDFYSPPLVASNDGRPSPPDQNIQK